MASPHTVLLLGATGRTGRRALQQLLELGVQVRVIVRARAKLSPAVTGSPNLTVIEASLLSLRDDELRAHLRGCDAVVSCLGHVLSLRGVFGPPRDLVTRATTRVCRELRALQPTTPARLILMSSVSVNRPGGLDTRRSSFERGFLWLLRALLPPARDNQRAADFLCEQIGPNDACVSWVVLRPDTLREGEASEYVLHEGIVDSLFTPGSTNMASVAHAIGQLVTQPETWAAWVGKLPVLVNAPHRELARRVTAQAPTPQPALEPPRS